jgi:tRNA G10  N-methylase Trm11
MEDYFFFLGRNPSLSLQEIISFLEARGIMGSFKQEGSIALFSLEKPLDTKDMIGRLGGTIKIGKSVMKGSSKSLIGKLKELNVYQGFESKVKFTLNVYPEDAEMFKNAREILEDYFKKEKIRALFRQPSETPSGSMKFDLEFFIIKLGKDYHFGKIEAVYDSRDAEFRDMNKPFRRSEYAISPRLAKILINLSGISEGETLLDPFCGVGTILQEALLQNINVIGIDVDAGVIENCKRNILWLRKNYEINAGYQIFCSNAIDIQKIVKEKVDAIASEPFLIPLITYTPKDKEARKMITKAKETYIKTLFELKKALKSKSRISLSLPVMKAREGKVYLNIEEICQRAGLKMVAGPFAEAREGQRVEREIVVLESY